MAGQKPYTFSNIEAITTTTQLYTQRRSSAATPAERKFTVADLAAFLESTMGWISNQGEYDDDSAAATGGVAVGEFYTLSVDNIYGMPQGLLKKRIA
jgi:hypothetical protein